MTIVEKYENGARRWLHNLASIEIFINLVFWTSIFLISELVKNELFF